jgi:hypothetical protein
MAYADISKIMSPFGSTDPGLDANPFSGEHWNMAEQSKIYKESPETAKYLAAMAKQKI